MVNRVFDHGGLVRSSGAPWVFVLGLALGGCGGSDKGSEQPANVAPERAACERLDECNYLPPGNSIAECSDTISACLDDLNSAELAAWSAEVEDCLKFDTCRNFSRCFAELPCGVVIPSPRPSDAGTDAMQEPVVPADAGPGPEAPAKLVEDLIQFSPMYSAFDDNMHEYAVTPSVPSAAESSLAADPVRPESLVWSVDTAFVKVDEFPDLPAAIRLTTKRAGRTVVRVTGETVSGVKVRGEATLQISRASAVEWDAGEARYNNGVMIEWMPPAPAAAGEGICGLPIAAFDTNTAAACGNCHTSQNNGTTVEHTPTQTAGYSDEKLIEIFTMGAMPDGKFSSPFLKMAPMPECIFKAFHTWEMTDDEKKGIVWKLRSLPPKVQAEIDFGRL
jgi:cytochrome c553